MKVVDISILNTNNTAEPIPLCAATDLTAYGYFQRQVRKDTHVFTDVD